MLGFPPLEWVTCGPGCDEADVVQDYDYYGGAGFPLAISMVPTSDGWQPLLSFAFGTVQGDADFQAVRVVRLDSGESTGIIKATARGSGNCDLTGGFETARAVSVVYSRTLMGIAPVAGEAWQWAAPAEPLPYARMGFDVDLGDGEGTLFWLGFGTVYKQRTPSSSEYEILEDMSGSRSGSGQGDLALWTDYSLDHERIRGWASDGKGVRTIVERPPVESCDIVASPSSIVAIAKRGRLESDSLYEPCGYPADEVRLWRSPRAYDPSGVAIDLGVPLPVVPALVGQLVTWGDYAAFLVRPIRYTGDRGYTSVDPSTDRLSADYYVVVRLSTWEAWRVNAPEGNRIQAVHALSHDALYFASSPGVPPSIDRVIRIPLPELDLYGERL